MTARSLFDPVLEQGILDANFFEGRLLTAEALRDAQRAQTERQRLLGRAVGAGVVEGLGVRLETARTGGRLQTITIERGLALDGEGNALRLKQDLTCDVVPPAEVPEPPATLFQRCADVSPAPAAVPVGVGLWILVMSPASGYRGRAEKSGLGSEGKIIGCGARWAVDGVKLRLEALRPESMASAADDARARVVALLQDTGAAGSRSLLRNLVAHLCLGDPQGAFAADPFARAGGASAVLRHGALDDLRALGRLGGCDVPLAVLLWNEGGVAFLDLWAVRRRPVAPAVAVEWPLAEAARARAEAEARFLQFQAHLADVVAGSSAPGALAVGDWFRWLPPAALLPLASPARPGLAVPSFLSGRTWRGPVFVEGARLMAALDRAARHRPIDLAEAELLWVYLLRQNMQPAPPATTPTRPPFAVLATGHLPFVGDARFDVNRWNYANYASLQVR